MSFLKGATLKVMVQAIIRPVGAVLAEQCGEWTVSEPYFNVRICEKCLPFCLPTEKEKAAKSAKQTTRRDYRKVRFVPKRPLSALRRKGHIPGSGNRCSIHLSYRGS